MSRLASVTIVLGVMVTACALAALLAGCAGPAVYTYPVDVTAGQARITGTLAAGNSQAVADLTVTGPLPVSNETVQASATVAPDGTATVHLRLVVR